MTYIVSIKTALIVFPLLAFFITIPFIIMEYHKRGAIHPLRTIIIYSFILYLLTVYFLVILPLPKIEEVGPKPDMFRFVPLGCIRDILSQTSFQIGNPSTYLKALTEPCIYTVVLNIVMTIPFGMYLRYYFKCDVKKTCFYSFLLSLFFELTQASGLYFIYSYPYRVFDIDDLITNTLGGFLGYNMMIVLESLLPSREKIDEETRKNAQKVSGLRKIFIFGLDTFLFVAILLFLNLFWKTNYLFLITFLLYFVIYPFLTKGKTFGSSFLNVRVEYPNLFLIRQTIRILFLYLYYFYFPLLCIQGTIYIKDILFLNPEETILLLFGCGFFLFLFYLANILIVLIKKKNFYDIVLNSHFKSTLPEIDAK